MKKIFAAIDPVLKVVLTYLLLATTWILLSDRLTYLIAANQELITAYQTYKGLFFVFATAILLYVLIKRINNELRQSRDRVQKIMDQSPAVICTVDKNGAFVQVNEAVEETIGYPAEDLINKQFINFVHPDDVKITKEVEGEIVSGTEFRGFNNRYVHKNGDAVHLEWSARWDAEEELMYAVALDVTALKEVENEMTKERNLLRAILDNIPDYIFAKDHERRITLDNEALREGIFGSKMTTRAIGKTAYELYEPEIAKNIDDDDKKVIETGEPIINREEKALNHKGDTILLQTTKVPLKNHDNEIYGLVGITRDITDQKEAEQKLRESLKEKEVLLAEIHHRVKNNLAVISGMMQLQAFDEETHEVKNKLLDSVSRIKSMAYIHELLYRSKSFSDLDFSANIKKLVNGIADTISTQADVTLEFKADPVQLNVNQAMPASLITNEVVTNILKYAFKDLPSGTITTELTEAKNRIKITFTHNGTGPPEDLDTEKHLGLHLIDVLSKQLNAHYEYETTAKGALFTFEFEKSNAKGIGNAHL